MSRSPSPARSKYSHDGTGDEVDQELDELDLDEGGAGVPCRWTDCSKTFSNSSELGKHCSELHVPACKPQYTCLWDTCTRKGLPQASKFALITHLRMHTGERPYKCDQYACERAFTRQDALAKHKRQQHNMNIPMPGRGGNRKRKHSQLDGTPAAESSPAKSKTQDSPAKPQDSPTRSERRPTSPVAAPAPAPPIPTQAALVQDSPPTPAAPVPLVPPQPAHDTLPPLPPHVAPPIPTNLPSLPETLHGVGRYKAAYLIEKAKLGYITREHHELKDELRLLQHEENQAYNDKERMLDHVLRASFPASTIEPFLSERPPP
ncbi:hypothetical protein AURDEDRAFT_157342 [Auricularia subglabra TFB-10046 SS5]|nr:hypothetical protein AURDEDRAFT_157342 [Auricularia subglabra TFB-10046 SS5]